MIKKLLLFVVTAALASAGYAAVPTRVRAPQKALSSARSEAPKKKAPESDTWKNLGKGIYSEDLLTVFAEIPVGLRWEVDIEQSNEHPGWYRIQPYVEGSEVAKILGSPDNTYLYLNATDEYKVYAEDFCPYSFEISNITTTTGWPTGEDYQWYGYFQDGIITFYPGSFAIGYGSVEENRWIQTSLNGGFQLAMPGVDLPDYSFGLSVPVCVPDNKFEVPLFIGESVGAVYLLLREGEWFVDDDGLEDTVYEFGTPYYPGDKLAVFTPETPGIYTILILVVDEYEMTVSTGQQTLVCVDMNESDWKSIGNAKMTEDVFSASYDYFEPDVIVCEVQESISRPGLYRLRDPYYSYLQMAPFMVSKDDHRHNHDLYINATDPDRVYVEPSAIGVNYNGESIIWSRAGQSLSLGYTPEEVEEDGQFGKLDKNIVTMPVKEVMLSEKNYVGGEFFGVGNNDFLVELPDLDGVSDIKVDTSTDVPVYYNLQGVRIDKPASGQLYIRVSKGKAEKQLAR